MLNTKQKNLLKSFRFKLIAALILLGIAVILFVLLRSKNSSVTGNVKNDSTSTGSSIDNTEQKNKPADLKLLQSTLDRQVDSILYTFGIRKEWISTYSPGQKTVSPQGKQSSPKRDSKEAAWFVKDVLIPRELTSAEVNMDVSLHVNTAGLKTNVNEDIRTKDIVIDVRNVPDSTASQPLARIYITHSDKCVRETGVFCLVLNNLGEFKKDDFDRILANTNEFTYVLPRSIDNVEIQNKLIQGKKDVVANLTVSAKDNSDADFTSADEKDIKQKVKSFNVDYPSVRRVLLTKSESGPAPPFTAKVAEELTKYDIRVFTDSSIITLLSKADEESKDKIQLIVNAVKLKAAQTGKGISVLTLSIEEFDRFYSEMLILKKLGYKFYTLGEYIQKDADKQKKDKLKEEKLKDEKGKDDKNKKTVKDKPKGTDKKDIKKNLVKPKSGKDTDKKKPNTTKKNGAKNN